MDHGEAPRADRTLSLRFHPTTTETVEYATVEVRIIREIGGDVKTQISYKKLDGDTGVALVNGEVSTTLQAKRELARTLDAPAVDEAHGEGEDIDARLRNFGIEPGSVQHLHISE